MATAYHIDEFGEVRFETKTAENTQMIFIHKVVVVRSIRATSTLMLTAERVQGLEYEHIIILGCKF